MSLSISIPTRQIRRILVRNEQLRGRRRSGIAAVQYPSDVMPAFVEATTPVTSTPGFADARADAQETLKVLGGIYGLRIDVDEHSSNEVTHFTIGFRPTPGFAPPTRALAPPTDGVLERELRELRDKSAPLPVPGSVEES
jgi:hypothetical protein